MSTSAVRGTFQIDEWQARRVYVRHVEESCRRLSIDVEWLSDFWVAKLTKDARTIYISGSLFPLNDAAAAGIARDKVATYHVLKAAGLPMIPHWLVRFPREIDTREIAEAALKNAPLPLVLKPCNKGGGTDVYKVTTHEELIATLLEMAPRYQVIAASPFVQIAGEYRVVLLDQQPQLLFRKVQKAGEWRHNFQFGGHPEAVADAALRRRLETFAAQITKAIGLRFCAVDIVQVGEALEVMEVNAGFSLNKLANSSQFEPLITRTYDQAIAACFA